MSLMTPDQARARWPEDDYPTDSLGGHRREVILKAWQLIDELRQEVEGTKAQEVAEVAITSFVDDLTEQHQRIDQLQAESLSVAFREVMGYDLPGVDR